MTQSEALARLRIILDETTASFWADADLYKLIDSGQNAVIDDCLKKETEMRKVENNYRHPTLSALIALDSSNTTTVGSGEQEYSIPADYLATYSAEYDSSGAQAPYGVVCKLLPYEEIKERQANTYKSAIASRPYYYINAEKIGFFPQPSGGAANNYIHKYYKTPTAVASGQAFTLREEAHEACIEYAAWKALEKDGEYQEAQVHAQAFNNLLNKL